MHFPDFIIMELGACMVLQAGHGVGWRDDGLVRPLRQWGNVPDLPALEEGESVHNVEVLTAKEQQPLDSVQTLNPCTSEHVADLDQYKDSDIWIKMFVFNLLPPDGMYVHAIACLDYIPGSMCIYDMVWQFHFLGACMVMPCMLGWRHKPLAVGSGSQPWREGFISGNHCWY